MTNLLADIQFDIENKAVRLPEAGTGLEKAASNILGTFTIFGGIAMVLYLAYGAITYITSGGDKAQIEKAQKAITNAIIGIVIIVLVMGISAVVGTILGFEILTPEWIDLGGGGAGSGGSGGPMTLPGGGEEY